MNLVLLLAATFQLTDAAIVLPENAEPSTFLSAMELTNYIFRISGKQMKMGGEGSPTLATRNALGTVRIGTLKTLKDVPAEAKASLDRSTSYEAAWTGIKDGTLWIVGKEEVAELYATYHFLEMKLGVRWFQAELPEDPGDYVPKADAIEIEPFAEFREPDFEVRRLDMCCNYWYQVPKAGKTCAIRNGYQAPGDSWTPNPQYPDVYGFDLPRQSRRQRSIGGGHVMFTAPTRGMKFEEHPEYFALVKGVRRPGLQFCFSSEGLLRRTADYIVARYRENDGLGDYLFGQADVTYGWCECEKCRAMDPPGTDYESNGPNVSTRLYKMSEKIAKMVRAEVPDADLRLWAYNTYRELPVGVTPDPALKVQFCDHGRCYGHHLDDPTCVRNVEMLKLMKDWLKVWPKLYTYEYFCCTPPLYVCHEHDEAHDLRLYKSLGMIGWKNEGYFTGSKWVSAGPYTADIYPSNWQWAYATGHLLWDVNLDLDALLEDAESKYYGRAAAPMKKYHALRRRLWDENKSCMGYPMDDPKRPTLLAAAGAKESLLAHLDDADKLAVGDKILQFRLGRDRRWLNDYWIKPHEKMVEEEKRAMTAKRIAGKIVIDGVGDEADWQAASRTDDFHKTVARKDGTYPELDQRLKTEVRVLRDDENLYVLCTALEPHTDKMVLRHGHDKDNWNGDGLEMMIAPPAVDCRYYQIATTANGEGVYDASHPGANVADDYDIEVKGKIHANRYVIEMRIPVKKMHAFRSGEVWRILFGRNRSMNDEIYSHHWEHNFSVGGSGFHDKTSFTPVKID